MINCRPAARLLSDEMDREISVGDHLARRLHTLICSGCRHYRRQMSFLRQTALPQRADTAAAPSPSSPARD